MDVTKPEKLCPHCKLWTNWDGNLEDRCFHCDEYLKLAEIKDIEIKEKKQKQLEFNFKEKFPFYPKENDPIIIKSAKQLAYGVYFVFMSIMVTLLWIIFWLAS